MNRKIEGVGVKKRYLVIANGALFHLLAGWGSETSIVSREHKINVQGLLETHANPQARPIENIALGGLTEGIVFYPIARDVLKSENKMLSADPELGEKDYLDFVQDIASITVPDFTDVWTYKDPKKSKSYRPTKYLVVDVELKPGKSGTAGKVERYFVNASRTLTCRLIDDGVVREKSVPLSELKKLTVTVAGLRAEQNRKK
jgi:hypothetical protein